MRNAIAATCMCVLIGCGPRGTMLRADPVQGQGQDVVYKNGMPIIISKLESSTVVVQPMANATGRYAMQSRVGFVAAVYNQGSRRVEVAETSFLAVANNQATHVMRAVEIEDEIRTSAAWAQTFNAVAGALVIAGSRSSLTRYVAAVDTARTSQAIEVSAQAQTAQLASALQRTTLDPGESVIGGISIEAPRDSACSPDAPLPDEPTVRTGAAWSRRSGPCRWTLYVNVGGEKHVIRFNEAVGL